MYPLGARRQIGAGLGFSTGGDVLAQFRDASTFWLQADLDSNANYNDNDTVTTAYDVSTNQLDCTTGAGTVVYKTNQLNTTLPAFQLSGSASLVKAAVSRTTLFPNANQLSYIAVLKHPVTAGQNCTISWNLGGELFEVLPTYSDVIYFDVVNQGAGRVSVAQPAGWDDNWHILELYKNTVGTADIIVDGVTLLSGASQTATFSANQSNVMTLWRIGTSPAYFTGLNYLQAILPTSLSAGDRTTLRNGIKSLTGL